jgi:DNA repair exonuclease SbcCD ATPase subunit
MGLKLPLKVNTGESTMKLTKIQMERFRSFRRPQEIVLPSRGLIHVTGCNEVNPNLGANGCGKTTLFEAPYWCFFGKISRGLRAGAVANWRKPKGCAVMIDGVAHGKEVNVCRTWGPNSLTLNGHEVDQQTLEKELSISPDTYIYSHFFPQFTTSFLDLTPERKLSLMTDVMRLGVWEKASSLAGKQSQELSINLARLEGSIPVLEANIKALGEKAAELEDEEQRWENGRDDRIESKIAAIKKQEAAFIPKGTLKKLSDKFDVVDKKHEENKQRLNRWLDESTRLKKEVRKYESLGDTCLYCGQKITKRHAEKELKKLKRALKSAKRWIIGSEASFNITLRSRNKILVEVKKLNDRVAEAKSSEVTLRHMDEALKELKSEENPYTLQHTKTIRDRTQLKIKVAGQKQELKAYRLAVSDTQFWIKGFKEVRLLEVEDALDQLEAEVNQTIHQLGLAGWQIKFDIEKENKTGGIRRGFTTMVISPDNKEYVPWEAWSGGESQRLRIAGTMGFANLIHSVSGHTPSVEMWDEPSTWLSPEGIDQMLVSLEARSRRYERAIMVADHRAFSYGGFANRLTIVKDKNGSRVGV